MLKQAPRPPVRSWRVWPRGALLMSGLWWAGPGHTTTTETITAARYIEPTTRYAHGVLGDDIEYGALEITIEKAGSKAPQDNPEVRVVRLPKDRVFEDLAPRLADVNSDGTNEVVVIETQANSGAQLAIYDSRGKKIAATPHIGTRNRWLAPAGIWDLDGEGHIEIAYVDRPHLAKTLRIWRFENGNLTEIATLPGLTNHRIGDAFIAGGLRYCSTGPELILANANWSRIIKVSYQDGWKATDIGPLGNRKELISGDPC